MLGGVQDLVRDRMQSEGIYNEFKDVLKVCLISILISSEYLLTTMTARVQYGVQECKGEERGFLLAYGPDSGEGASRLYQV